LHASWIFLSSGPPPAPYINDIDYNFDEEMFAVGWTEAPGSLMVNNFTFDITPGGLNCTMSSMRVTCLYNKTNLGPTYIFTVAALNCGAQKGSYASHRIHLRRKSLIITYDAI